MRSLRRAALCLAFCWAAAAGAQTAAAPKHSEESAEAVDLMPRYLLQDVRGRVVTQESFRGRYQLISFGFISCPDVCPTTLLGYRNIIEALGEQAGRLQPLFVTVDPERDHASVLRDYTAAFHPAILGLRGSSELLQRAAQSFRVRYEKVREPGAAADVYTMDHSTGMYLLDGEGRFVTKFSMTANAQEVAARIGDMMAADRGMPANRSGKTPLR
jgi:protein SCO1/2